MYKVPEQIEDFAIHFSKPSYSAGEVLSGYVKLILTRPIIKANQFRLEISGRANTEWSERNNKDSYTLYSGETIYLNQTFVFWEKSNEKDILDQGNYLYDFTLQIPSNAPSSFAFKPKGPSFASKGHIIYYAYAVLCREKSWKDDESVIKPFNVLSLLDLNSNPQLSRPLQVVEKNLSGKISLLVITPKSGFLPGQTINLEARLTNNSSSKKIKRIEASLSQSVVMKAYKRGKVYNKTHEKFKETIVAHADLALGVAPNTPNRQVFWDIQIPGVSPTLKTCPNIEIYYTLFLKLSIGGFFGDSIKVSFPITLGTIAFHNDHDVLPVQDDVELDLEWLKSQHCVTAPPSYSECKKTNDSSDGED